MSQARRVDPGFLNLSSEARQAANSQVGTMGPFPSRSGGGGDGNGIDAGTVAGTALQTGAAGIDAILGYFGTQAKNKALEDAMARVRQQGVSRVRQIEAQGNDVRRARIRAQREAAGRLRVLRASGLGGSFSQRAANLGIDASADLATNRRNVGLSIQSTTQSVNNALTELNNQIQDPLLVAGTAFAQGAVQAAKAAATGGAGGG